MQVSQSIGLWQVLGLLPLWTGQKEGRGTLFGVVMFFRLFSLSYNIIYEK
jgi:hypothetical protein